MVVVKVLSSRRSWLRRQAAWPSLLIKMIILLKKCQNDSVYGPFKKADITPNKPQSSLKIRGLCWCFLSGKNKDTQRPNVNSETHSILLHKHLLPDRRTLYPQNNYVFQQDGAPSHTSRASPDYLTENTNQFIKIDEWPPQSAGCNPMDYAIWDMLSERVYAGQIHKFTEPKLKQKILKVWLEVSLTEIQASIYVFGKRDSSV